MAWLLHGLWFENCFWIFKRLEGKEVEEKKREEKEKLGGGESQTALETICTVQNLEYLLSGLLQKIADPCLWNTINIKGANIWNILSRGLGIHIVIILSTDLQSLHRNTTVKDAVILLAPPLTADAEISDILNSLERIFQDVTFSVAKEIC